MEKLTIKILKKEAVNFCYDFSNISHTNLFRISDGKKIGTYIEVAFKKYLLSKYDFNYGNSSLGIDFIDINTDLKVSSVYKPQSSAPFQSARQKIYGLGYNILLFLYDKVDLSNTSILKITNCIFISKDKTADYNITKHLNYMLDNNASQVDIVNYLQDINLPASDGEIISLSKEIMTSRPKQGYITISNALQYRLHYPYALSMKNDLEIFNYEFK